MCLPRRCVNCNVRFRPVSQQNKLCPICGQLAVSLKVKLRR